MLSVIIPTHNRDQQLLKLVRYLSNQSLTSSAFEIIVAGNLHSQSLAWELDKFRKIFPHLKYVCSGVVGVNAARNRGIQEARGSVLAFLDDDCLVLDRDYFVKIISRHRDHPEAAAIGGRYRMKAHATLIERTYYYISDSWLTNSILEKNKTLNLVGGNTSYKSWVLSRNYLFNEEIRFGGAETELNSRLVNDGHSLLLFDDLSVLHQVRVSLYGFIRRAFLQGGSRCRLEMSKDAVSVRFFHHQFRQFLQMTSLGEWGWRRLFISWYCDLFDLCFRLGKKWAWLEEFEESLFKRVKLLMLFLFQPTRQRIQQNKFLWTLCQCFRFHWLPKKQLKTSVVKRGDTR